MVEHKGALCLAPMCSRPSEGSLWGAGVCRRGRPRTRHASQVSERTRCLKGQYPHFYIGISKDSTPSVPKASLPPSVGPVMIDHDQSSAHIIRTYIKTSTDKDSLRPRYTTPSPSLIKQGQTSHSHPGVLPADQSYV